MLEDYRQVKVMLKTGNNCIKTEQKARTLAS